MPAKSRRWPWTGFMGMCCSHSSDKEVENDHWAVTAEVTALETLIDEVHGRKVRLRARREVSEPAGEERTAEDGGEASRAERPRWWEGGAREEVGSRDSQPRRAPVGGCTEEEDKRQSPSTSTTAKKRWWTPHWHWSVLLKSDQRSYLSTTRKNI